MSVSSGSPLVVTNPLIMKIELISFEACPFVQRSVITLIEKGIDHEIKYIDLANKPDWFLEISPFGKVPVLKTDQGVLFESAVINEYLDETNPPSMHPTDPFEKAQNRAWIEFGSSLNMDAYHLSNAATEAEFEQKKTALKAKFQRLEAVIQDGPYFNGSNYSLIDSAYAPFFQRLQYVEDIFPLAVFSDFPKVKKYASALLERESTTQSVVPDLAAKYLKYLKEKNSYLAQMING